MKLWRLYCICLFCAVNMSACREDDVTDTNQYIVEINSNISKYKHKTIDLTGVSTLNGTIVGYFSGGEFVKGIVSTYSESNRKIETYYFKSGNVVCVQKQEYTYNTIQSLTEDVARKQGDSTWYDDAKTVVKTNIFYFYDKRLVKWINQNKRQVPETDRAYQTTTATLLEDADKLQKMFRD